MGRPGGRSAAQRAGAAGELAADGDPAGRGGGSATTGLGITNNVDVNPNGSTGTFTLDDLTAVEELARRVGGYEQLLELVRFLAARGR